MVSPAVVLQVLFKARWIGRSFICNCNILSTDRHSVGIMKVYIILNKMSSKKISFPNICFFVYIKNRHYLIFIQKVVPYPVLLVFYHRVQIDIFNAFEDICLYERIGLLKLRDQLLRLKAFGGRCAVLVTGRTGIRKMTCALKKMKLIEIAPGADIALPDQIHRSYELHPLEIRAVQLGQHGLELCAVKHAHDGGFDHVAEMMAQCDFVAA